MCVLLVQFLKIIVAPKIFRLNFVVGNLFRLFIFICKNIVVKTKLSLSPRSIGTNILKDFVLLCNVIVSKFNAKHKNHSFLKLGSNYLPDEDVINEEKDDEKDDEKKMCVDDIPILSKPNVVLDVKVELPSWKEIWSVYSPTVLSIPNPLIADWCEILEKLVNPLTTLKPDNTEIHWKRFFMVSKCLWYAPIRAGQKKKKEEQEF